MFDGNVIIVSDKNIKPGLNEIKEACGGDLNITLNVPEDTPVTPIAIIEVDPGTPQCFEKILKNP